MSDAVNKPAHYNQGSIECIEAMKIVLTPEEFRGYLKGNAMKYLWREKDKNGIEDLKKAKWYLDRLIKSFEDDEEEVNDILQSLKDHPFGKLRQPAWTPKIGDWVRIKKPADALSIATAWFSEMDWYDGQIIKVKEIVGEGVVQDGWGFLFEWLEPVEKPVVKQSLTPEPPDGWRWLEVGEILRRLDASFNANGAIYELNPEVAGRTVTAPNVFIRRNRFEVSEKVVSVLDEFEFVIVDKHSRLNDVYVVRNKITGTIHNILNRLLAPYIEETK